ncbi:protein of unknown function [Aneurinibacillus thermoaerophilus]|uniref:IrrE N-terminal-like domain-containing protein n=1 Tax=Aneurinibacillus thermoaerophilus TaxID=143495 RepID=A0A1G8FKK6_ANETH|nr:ImmA/IrrE family metallo-endopeptidase [Aneurinibacillus thermoaerophilus]SDH82638.1 protein of unknown function [Aneurinibacillus thermoaerophilus]
MLDLSLYKPTALEKWIEKIYKANNILTPRDMDIYHIAEIFGGDIMETPIKSHARWEDDGDGYFVIFLNRALDELSRRSEFHHELCHPLQHVGIQERLPKPFKDLQERQARIFQLYASIPFFMVKELNMPNHKREAIGFLAEEFKVPYKLAADRLNQIGRRIFQARFDIQFAQYLREEEQKINGKTISYKIKD